MSDHSRRRELKEQYRQTQPEAGVFCIRNSANNKTLLGSTRNLASLRNRLAFAKSTRVEGALDPRLNRDLRQFGIDAFSLEVLEILEITPEMTPAEIASDLATLEALWRERFDPGCSIEAIEVSMSDAIRELGRAARGAHNDPATRAELLGLLAELGAARAELMVRLDVVDLCEQLPGPTEPPPAPTSCRKRSERRASTSATPS